MYVYFQASFNPSVHNKLITRMPVGHCQVWEPLEKALELTEIQLHPLLSGVPLDKLLNLPQTQGQLETGK